MRSTFLGFNAARSGIFAAQRSLDITGHNIANVNTPGYSRQRLEQAASNPMPLPGKQGMLGAGVDTLTIKQLRDEFLDYKYRGEANALGYWRAKQEGLYYVESVMDELSETGLSTVLDEMFASFQQLSKPENANNLSTRALVRQNAEKFANLVNQTYNKLEKMVQDLNFDIATAVSSINSYAEQIALLNSQIARSEMSGSNANDLRDQRNLLIDELSELVDVDIIEVGSMDGNTGRKTVIQINGQPLVYHDRAYKLTVDKKEKSKFFEDMGVDLEVNVIEWENGGRLNINSINGELKALIELRDGTGQGGAKGIPFYIGELNRFVEVLAREMNDIHSKGFGLDGESGYYIFTANGVTSEEMKTIENDSKKKINAKNISTSLDIEDLNKIAAASERDLLPGDGSNALKLAELRDDLGMFKEGKPEDFLKSLVSNLGVDSLEAIRNTENQTFLTAQVDLERQRVSGVHLDEELSNMVRYQHAYNASARMITTIDEMLDVIINRLGIVGR
ncbi:MAG: flagellar hook-associated protein FlgK [Clostridiales bacterium]|nr:flagellar hook-associated protein FlgK [Clostridiales bacterium]